MVIANKPFTLSGTLLGGAFAAAITGLSFTSEITAQVPALNPAPATQPAPVDASPQAGPSNIIYHPSIDRLDVLFPSGVVATVADRSITVADIRRHVAPMIPRLQRDARTQDEFNGRLASLQNSAVNDLVTRALLIRQFHDQKDGEQAKQIPAEYIDNYIADSITERFEGDRTKFLAHLKEKGMTQRDYRKMVEEQIIHNYMRSQERKLIGTGKQAKAVPADRPLRLRIIELTRTDGESDAALMETANAILARFRNGESFESLAREFDRSKRREQGGDWGWFRSDELKAEYRDVTLALEKGEVSAPILTKEACLLVYVEERR